MTVPYQPPIVFRQCQSPFIPRVDPSGGSALAGVQVQLHRVADYTCSYIRQEREERWEEGVGRGEEEETDVDTETVLQLMGIDQAILKSIERCGMQLVWLKIKQRKLF